MILPCGLWCLLTVNNILVLFLYHFLVLSLLRCSNAHSNLLRSQYLSLAIILTFIDRQEGVYGSTDTTFLHLLSLCYPRNKAIWIWMMRKKHSSVKESLYTGSCILEKGNLEQIGIMMPVKSHRRLLTFSSNPRGFIRNGEAFGLLYEYQASFKARKTSQPSQVDYSQQCSFHHPLSSLKTSLVGYILGRNQ